jgi:hypothetical protein
MLLVQTVAKFLLKLLVVVEVLAHNQIHPLERVEEEAVLAVEE